VPLVVAALSAACISALPAARAYALPAQQRRCVTSSGDSAVI